MDVRPAMKRGQIWQIESAPPIMLRDCGDGPDVVFGAKGISANTQQHAANFEPILMGFLSV